MRTWELRTPKDSENESFLKNSSVVAQKNLPPMGSAGGSGIDTDG